MPIIPDATKIKREAPQQSVGLDISSAGKGYEAMGGAIDAVGGELIKMQDRVTDNQLATAENQYQAEMINLTASYQSRSDIDNFDQSFEEEAQKIKDKYIPAINDANKQQRFSTNADANKNVYGAKVEAMRLGKFKDQSIVELETLGQQNRDAIVTSSKMAFDDGEREKQFINIRDAMETKVHSLINLGAMDPSTGQTWMKQWMNGSYKSYVLSLPEDQRVKALNEAKPFMTKTEYDIEMQKASGDALNYEARKLAEDFILNRNLDSGEVLAEASKITDNRKYDAVLKYATALKSQKLAGDSQRSAETVNTWSNHLDGVSGEYIKMSLEELQTQFPDEWEALPLASKNSLISKATKPAPTGFNVGLEMEFHNTLKMPDGKRLAQDLYSHQFANLPAKQAEEWFDVLFGDGGTPAGQLRSKSLQYGISLGKRMKLGDNEQKALDAGILEWSMQTSRDKGVISDEEMQKGIRKIFNKVVIEGAWYTGGDERVRIVSMDRSQELQVIENKFPNIGATIRKSYAERGVSDPTPDQMIMMYDVQFALAKKKKAEALKDAHEKVITGKEEKPVETMPVDTVDRSPIVEEDQEPEASVSGLTKVAERQRKSRLIQSNLELEAEKIAEENRAKRQEQLLAYEAEKKEEEQQATAYAIAKGKADAKLRSRPTLPNAKERKNLDALFEKHPDEYTQAMEQLKAEGNLYSSYDERIARIADIIENKPEATDVMVADIKEAYPAEYEEALASYVNANQSPTNNQLIERIMELL